MTVNGSRHVDVFTSGLSSVIRRLTEESSNQGLASSGSRNGRLPSHMKDGACCQKSHQRFAFC